MTVREARENGIKCLRKKKVESPESSTDFLLRDVLDLSREEFLAQPNRGLSLSEARKFRRFIKRRSRHEPVWYVTGKIEFFGHDFVVNKNVLVPRPETELLVETIVVNSKRLKANSQILDIGTGSGAIILSLAKKIDGDFFASDISSKALAIARKNRKKLGLEKKVIFKKGDLLFPWLGQKFDLIVANLPYVPHEDMSSLSFDLIHYEPRIALDGGNGGLDVYERFFKELPFFLNKKGMVYCEIGYEQGDKVKKMVKKVLPKAKITIWRDYSKTDRVAIIKT